MYEEEIPTVSGISPAEGPPGTIVKIRGENLGKNAKDVLRIYICNVDCTYTAEWKSSKLIQARTGMGLGLGDIIVFTKSGGMGSSLVKFKGYMPRVGLLTEAAVWVDESKLFEEKPTSSLSKSRAFASNAASHTDPLGIAPEETGAMLPTDKLEEWYPGCSSNPLAENFHPIRFLLERHLDTSFDALKSGYHHLQTQDTRKSVGPTSLVRGNLTTILDALYTLNGIQKSMTVHESDSHGGNICEELQGLLKSCNFASHSLFKDILTRKDEADVKRNVLSVLHRYRFLFSMPRSIEKNIQQGEYEILISDYNRVKALFQNTEVKSFKKALADIDQNINAFTTKLKYKLFDFPTPLEDQKKIIRYLNDLDYPGNAGWECITKQTLWIKSMLLDCQVEHQIHDSRLMSPPNSTLNVRERTDILHYESTYHLTTDMTDSGNIFNELTYLTSQAPHSVLMVEDLCKIVMEHLPDLWNLGQTYLNNQLGDKKRSNEDTASDREKFQSIVRDVLIVMCEMIQNVLQPEEMGKNLSKEKERKMQVIIPFLPNTVKKVKSALDCLNKLGLTADVAAPMKSLTTSLIGDCVKRVLRNYIREIHSSYKQEFWELDYSEKLYSTTKLPMMLQKVFLDAVQFVYKFLKDSKIDTKNETRLVRNDVIILLKQALKEFPVTLAKTVFPDVKGSTESLDNMIFHPNPSQLDTVKKDTKVLLLLSNCYHVRNVIVPRVVNECLKCGFNEIEQVVEEVKGSLDELDSHVFSTFLEMNTQPLIEEMESAMQYGDLPWNLTTEKVRGVRRYLQDILMRFVKIHHEISTVSTLSIGRVFNVLCETITQELKRLYKSATRFSPMGVLHARLECDALRYALKFYLTDTATKNLDEALSHVPELESNLSTSMQLMMEEFQSNMQYQLSTFNDVNDLAPNEKPNDIADVTSTRFDDIATSQNENTLLESDKAISDANKVTTAEEKPHQIKTGDMGVKRTKRRAPAPPSNLLQTNNVTREESSNNPFLEDETNTNPFLDD